MLHLQTVHRPLVVSHDPPPVSPQDIGLPEKFKEWRSGQWSGVERILQSDKRFIVICAPTGTGKTGIGLGAALLSGDRTVILTATTGLQDQISAEAGSIVSDIRGLNNYLCPIAESLGIPKDTTVADAPCQCGYGCGLRKSGCGYYDNYRAAQRAGIVVTNYQCWMHDGAKDSSDRGDLQYGIPIKASTPEEEDRLRAKRQVRMLIADEIHDGEGQLCLFFGVDLSRRECLSMRLDWPDAGLTVDDWQQWAKEWVVKVGSRVSSAEQRMKSSVGKAWSKELKHLRDLKRKLERLSGMQTDDGWILNETEVQGKSMTSVRFDPLSPARYAEQALWRGVNKIVLVSATVRPKTVELLGIKPDEMEFCEYGSSFDPKRRPTVYVPSGVRMTYKTEQDDHAMRWWLGKLDYVIETRLHQKGIVHAVSYKRMKFIFDNSRHAKYMMIHNTRDRAQAVEAFRRREPPAIIISPSLDTGYDFHGPDARWQIIAKIPFASVQDKVIKARQDLDKEYGLYLAAQTLVQAAGRIVRSESDYGMTIVLDGSFEWFYWEVRKYLPMWFQEAVVWWDGAGMPKPLEFDDKPLTVMLCNWCNEAHEGGPEACRS
jgi:Rad3-related DNA helicase